MNITDQFVEQIMSFSNQEIPVRILHQVKRCILDYLGVTNAGAYVAKEKLDCYTALCASDGVCSIIGRNAKTDMLNAGLINGFSSHVIELDDGHRYGMLHLEAPVISSMFIVAQKEELNVNEFIIGVVTGYEATVRLAMGIQPMHKQRGFHATGTCGTIGVACAIAAALKFSKTEWKNAISAAATSAAGLLEVIDDASQLKPYNVAHAVADGIAAAYIGKSGFNGPEDVLGGQRGFFKSLTGEYKKEVLCENSNGDYAIEKIYVKPYAACRHCHSAIECALNISKREKLKWEEIESVIVETYKLAVFGHDHTDICGVSSAKMSTPYGVAISIITKNAGMSAFSEDVVKRQDVLELCKKVSVIENKELTAESPGKRGAIVTINMNNGERYKEKVEYPLGEPENNISDKDLEEKYKSLMLMSGVDELKVAHLSEIVWDLENRFEELIKLL